MYHLHCQNESILTLDSSLVKEGNFIKLYELEQTLTSNLEKLKTEDMTMLQEKIRRTEQHLGNSGKITLNEEKKRTDVKNFHTDLTTMPSCTEKTIMELLEHFERRLLEDCISTKEENIVSQMLSKLQDQINQQELFSEEIQAYLQDLDKAIHRNDSLFTVNVLDKLLKSIRPLNIQEIRRLIAKTKKAAMLIKDKEIILLVGATGVEKSTIVQFLAGTKIEERQLKVDQEQCLKVLARVESAKNSELSIVTSHPLNKLETRHIILITIQLKEIFGHYENGEIILCDAPDFGNSNIPEIDIVNGIEVIEAFNECRSIKILALLSYDREHDILKLMRTLIDMMNGIEDRLNSIIYVYTKCSMTIDINTLLTDMKTSSTHLFIESDNVFAIVLSDMIEKTIKIDPIHDDPKELIKKLKHVQGIAYPGEVFRFAISKETEATIARQIERDKSNIQCALKHRNNDLLMYYLNNLKVLKDLIKQNFIQDAYNDSISFISKNINEFCTKIMKNFNHALLSKDGLKQEDICKYKTSIEYIQKIQILRDHLGSDLISHEILIQNIDFELQKISQSLMQEDLYNPFVGIYLDNLRMLQNSFEEFQLHYNRNCENFIERLENWIHSAYESIVNNEFKHVTEILHILLQCSFVLKKHFDGRIEKTYESIVKLLLRHLSNFSEKVECLLAKIRLTDSDIEILKIYMKILRSAKENTVLQDHISTYVKMQEKKLDVSSQQTIRETNGENCIYFNEIYNQFISKIVKYFDEINERIREIFEKNGDYALEYIEKFVFDMEAIRTIPELELKTARSYYRIVENIYGYVQRLQKEAEELFFSIDHNSGIPNYRRLARALIRLKNSEWINRISPIVSNNLMRDITDELVQYAHQLEVRLMKLDLRLKYPDHICLAQEILEKIQSMSILERSIPELEKYRVNIFQSFLESTQIVFNHIKKIFNLQDRTVSYIKQELNKLEKIKREYENLHPAHVYLRKKEYSNIHVLNQEIEDLKSKKNETANAAETETCETKTRLSKLNLVVEKYNDLISFKTDQSSMIEKVVRRTKVAFQNSTQAKDYLREEGYSTIDDIYDAIEKYEKVHIERLLLIQEKFTELSNSLIHLESIRNEYEALMLSRDSISPEEMNFLEEKGYESSIVLDTIIHEKKRIFDECVKNKQTYYFSDRLDASTANNALVYIKQCEKVDHVRVKESAADAYEILQNYISEYGNFLHQEIRRKFNHIITCVDVQDDPFQYTHNLKMYLQELSSLSKFTYVFECINGDDKIEYWHREFLDYYHRLSYKLEEYKISGRNKDFINHLNIAQAFSCLDRFCEVIFANHGFRALYGQYRVEFTKDSRATYELVLNYISKGDYGNASIMLHDMDNNQFTLRDMAQIKYNLENSLKTLIKDTKSIAIWLDGTITIEQNSRIQIREIKENVEKIRTALSNHTIMVLLNDETRRVLCSFDNDMNEILSEIIFRGFRSIEACIDVDSFYQAEQSMDNLSCIQRELADIYTSDSITKKSEELKKKMDDIVNTISNRYDSMNVEDYPFHSPNDLLKKLETVALRGRTRYHQTRMSVLRKIQQNFSRAIDKLHDVPLDERPTKIRSLNYVLCFLPEELQAPFKSRIDEMSQLFTDEEKMQKRNFEVYSKINPSMYSSS